MGWIWSFGNKELCWKKIENVEKIRKGLFESTNWTLHFSLSVVQKTKTKLK